MGSIIGLKGTHKRLRFGGQSVLKYVVSFAGGFPSIDRADLRQVFVRAHMFCPHRTENEGTEGHGHGRDVCVCHMHAFSRMIVMLSATTALSNDHEAVPY